MGIKLLHTADLHLDRPLLGLGERRLSRRAEMRARFEEILGVARAKEAAALLIAGDLFDRPDAESGHWVKGHLAALTSAGIQVYLIPGNHDRAEICRFYTGGFPAGVHVFNRPEWESRNDLPGVTVYGSACAAAGRRSNPLAGLTLAAGGRWHVGLVHGQLRASELFGEDYAPFEPADISACGLDYLALGHYHGFKDCSVGRTRACYCGSPCRLDFSDTADRRLLLVELTDGPPRVEEIRLGDRVFLQIAGDAGEPEPLYEQLVKAANPEVYIRVRLSGRAREHLTSLAADLMEKFTAQCYGFEIVDDGVTGSPVAAQPGTVVHAFAVMMEDRLRRAANPEEAEMIRRAADYGMLALEGRQLP